MNGSGPRGISWNTHAIITRASLGPSQIPCLSESVPVLPLEEFLCRTTPEWQHLVAWYNGLIAAKSGIAPPADSGETPSCLTVADFLAGLRLNPTYRMQYVKVLQCDELPRNAAHDPSRDGPPGNSYVATPWHETLPVSQILAAFSDEPDWGLDQDLFSIEAYGYGPPPFGGRAGTSSQAPFHMAFFHEHPFLLRLLPILRRSFLEERVRVFFRLADLAFAKNVVYWGWRFTAWAMHYLQDLTQPYHATPFPPSWFKLLGRFLRDPRPAGFVERNKNCLVNRHLLFESAVHFMLNQAEANHSDHVFLRALADGREAMGGPVSTVLRDASTTAARLASRVDRATVGLFAHLSLDEPDYDLERDSSFRVEEALPEAVGARPSVFSDFSELVCRCLVPAGKVTRYAVSRAGDQVVACNTNARSKK